MGVLMRKSKGIKGAGLEIGQSVEAGVTVPVQCGLRPLSYDATSGVWEIPRKSGCGHLSRQLSGAVPRIPAWATGAEVVKTPDRVAALPDRSGRLGRTLGCLRGLRGRYQLMDRAGLA